MVLDTSGLVAMVLSEPFAARLLEAIEGEPTRFISSVSVLESGIVLRARAGAPIVPMMHALLAELSIEVIAFDEVQARLAIQAFERFGKGMKHRAQLNFGDCAVYALATSCGEAVLATGNDFRATGIAVLRF
jgi:ribonuclease VapC